MTQPSIALPRRHERAIPLVLSVAVLVAVAAAERLHATAHEGVGVGPLLTMPSLLAAGAGMQAIAWRRGRHEASMVLGALTFQGVLVGSAIATHGLGTFVLPLFLMPPVWAAAYIRWRVARLLLLAMVASLTLVAVEGPDTGTSFDLAEAALVMLIGVIATRHRHAGAREHGLERRRVDRDRDDLSALVGVLDAERDRERREVAGHIHDSALQPLSAALLHLGTAADSIPEEDEDTFRAVHRSQTLIRESVHALRRIMHGLEPITLQHLGLAAAIDERARVIGDAFGVRIVTNVGSPDVECSEDCAVLVYRLVVEAMMNAARHARAREVLVSLHVRGGSMFAEVRDDGDGLPEPGTYRNVAPPGAGMGIGLMVEKVRHAGGMLRFESTRGSGTSVAFMLRLVPEDGPT